MGFGWVVVLFVALPIVELALIIEVGSRIGTWSTVALVLGTGVAGSLLARAQGMATVRRIQEQLERGQVPSEGLLHALLVLIGGVLLLVPGLLTDAVGLLLLIPGVRWACIRWLRQRLEDGIQRGTVRVFRLR